MKSTTQEAIYYFTEQALLENWQTIKDYICECQMGEIKSAEELVDYIKKYGQARATDPLASPVRIYGVR